MKINSEINVGISGKSVELTIAELIVLKAQVNQFDTMLENADGKGDKEEIIRSAIEESPSDAAFLLHNAMNMFTKITEGVQSLDEASDELFKAGKMKSNGSKLHSSSLE